MKAANKAARAVAARQHLTRWRPQIRMPSNMTPSRRSESYADLVGASYQAAVSAAQALDQAVDELLAAPSEDTLNAARQAWVKARQPYLQTEVFRFYDGPIEEIEGRINAWPMNEAAIDYVKDDPKAGLINSDKDLTPEAIIGANQADDEANVTTGWHAIEFLLWGQDFSAEGPGDASRFGLCARHSRQ